MLRPTLCATAVLLCHGSALSAQESPVSARLPNLQRQVPLRAAEVHRNSAGETWATGPGYKARFDDGMVLFPTVGRDHAAAPFQWRTTAVRLGSRRIDGFATTPRLELRGRRIELHWGTLVEGYDVRADGIEQTFTLSRRPMGPGDLVVEGQISTALDAAPRPSSRGDLVFRHADLGPLVRYGAASAIDSQGRTTDIATGFDGRTIQLVLPARVLEQASYPLTIDPLVSAGPVLMQLNAIGKIALGSDASSKVIVHELYSSAGDRDIVAWRYDANFTTVQQIFVDADASDAFSPTVQSTGRTAGAPSVLAYVKNDVVRLYIHSGPAVNQGIHTVRTPYAGRTPRNPRLAYHWYFQSSLLAWEEGDVGTTAARQAVVTLVNTSSGAEVRRGWVDPLGAGEMTSLDFAPFLDGFSEPWIAVWQERTHGGEPWRVSGCKLDPQFLTLQIGFGLGHQTTASLVSPVVAGAELRFMVAYVESDTTSTAVFAQRFDFLNTNPGNAPTVRPARLVARRTWDPHLIWRSQFTVNDLAHHLGSYNWQLMAYPDAWEVTYNEWSNVWGTAAWLDRLSEDGFVVENYLLRAASATPVDSRVCQDYAAAPTASGLGRFAHVFTDTVPLFGLPGVYAGFGEFDPAASWSPYGAACGPGVIAYQGYPQVGFQRRVNLASATPSTAGGLLISTASQSLPLVTLGMTGCFLNVDVGSSFVGTVPVVTTSGGQATFAIPSFLGVIDLYFQFAYLWSGGNPRGVATTQGLELRCR